MDMNFDDSMDRPRETLREFTEDERKKLYDAAYEEVYSYVAENPEDAAGYILDKCEGDVRKLLDWTSVEHADDEGVIAILGYWPWKDDPIPARELGITPEVDDV